MGNLLNIHRFIEGKAKHDLNRESIFLISEMTRIQLFHEALDRGLPALGYWGRKQHKPIISHISSIPVYPEPLVLAKRNAGSVYVIGIFLAWGKLKAQRSAGRAVPKYPDFVGISN